MSPTDDNSQAETQIRPSSPLHIPKNRDTGNLLAGSHTASENAQSRYSFDVGSAMDTADQEPGGGGVSGLQRIRQQPLSRLQTQPPSPDATFSLPAQSAPMTLLSPSRQFSNHSLPTPRGPLSPSLSYKEELSRFPTESLHSFSFAQQSEDLLHGRQNVIKRCIDFMRDKLGWANNHAGLVTAQAKVSGDEELQSMVDLLARANILGNTRGDRDAQGMAGPMTGPAHTHGTNPFEKAFFPRRKSTDGTNQAIPSEPGSPQIDKRKALGDITNEPEVDQTSGMGSKLESSQALSGRPGLKRTRTDLSLLSLQTKLSEALSRPYNTKEDSQENSLLSPTPLSAFTKSMTTSAQVPLVVHGQTSRWAPPIQAILTTEAQPPWTILAANDLACLVFGIQKAEVRKLSILEIMREEDKAWLEAKLKSPGAEAAVKARQQENKSRRASRSSATSAMGGGITARLLSKPSSREQKALKGDASSSQKDNIRPADQSVGSSRGVLLCGDVVPIRKRNGATGTASLWVKEKRGGLIWVLEEVSEDSATITLDDDERVIDATGSTDAIWASPKIPPGIEIWDLVPKIPLKDAASSGPGLDYDKANAVRYYTAQNIDGINIPVSVSKGIGSHTLHVSSFPHIAGIIVLSANTLKITSSNPVFAAALFGHINPNGLHANDLIPQFDKILDIVTEEDEVNMLEGTVIPEHSFRKARRTLALREGTGDAASVFLRPTGLIARHRDGSEIYVDVQVRVVQSIRTDGDYFVIEGKSEEAVDNETDIAVAPSSEVVLALWVTYSRQLHSDPRPGGPATPVMSRPGTPLPISPGQNSPHISDLTSDLSSDAEPARPSRSPTLSQQIKEATSTEISSSLPKDLGPAPAPSAPVPSTPAKTSVEKRKITDFTILEDMGQGAYGQVKLARYTTGEKKGEKTVLKYVTKKRILVDTWTRDRRLGTVPLEVHVLDYLRRDGLKHPNIVEMTGFFEDDINYYIEMVPHGLPGMDLFDYIEMRPTMSEDECRDIFNQVVEALYHLHTKALVVHRDIKDENLILDGENKVKLIDFGSAAYIKNGPFDVFVGTIGKSFLLH